MIIIFKKLEEISDKELMKIGIALMGQNIYFILEQKMDSDEKYLLLYKFIMNDNIAPVSWEYFLDFIIELPFSFPLKIEC